MTDNDGEVSSLSVPSSQVITLIQHHLTESGLASSSRALLSESSIGTQGLLNHAHAKLQMCAKNGDWGQVLESLSNVTVFNSSSSSDSSDVRKKLDLVLGQVHEMAILELGDLSEMELAFATLRVCGGLMDTSYSWNEEDQGAGPLSRSVERRLHALVALLSLHSSAAVSEDNIVTARTLLPPDYYGINGVTKEKRRHTLSKRLGEVIPIIPSSRLLSLLQQAMKW